MKLVLRKSAILLLFVFIVLIATSCKQDPKQLYLKYTQNSEKTSEYKIVYSVETPDFKYLGSSDVKLGIFKKNEDKKIVLEVNAIGQSINTYSYNVGGKSLICNKVGGADKATCNKGDYSVMSNYEDYASIASKKISQNFTITYLGSQDIIGRKCDKFSIEVNNFSELLNSSSVRYSDLIEVGQNNAYNGKQARLDVCLDTKNSLSLLTKISIISKSELNDKLVENELIKLSATSLAEKVADSELEFPVSYLILGSACNKGEVDTVIEAYKDYNGPVNLNVHEQIYQTASQRGPSKTIKEIQKSISKNNKEILQFDVNYTYPNSYEMCIGNDCQGFYCYQGTSTNCIKKSVDKSICESDKSCIYSEPVCKEFRCANMQDEATCNSKKCQWKPSGGSYGYCNEKKCSDSKTKEDCTSSELGCSWRNVFGFSCIEKSCIDLKTKQECNDKLKCVWNEIGNYKACEQQTCFNRGTTEEECKKLQGCEWQTSFGSSCVGTIQE